MSSSDLPSHDPMPVWLDGNSIQPEWIQAVSGFSCTSCTAKDVSNETRKSDGDAKDGATLRLTLTNRTALGEGETKEQNSGRTDDSSTQSKSVTLIVKQTPHQGLALSKRLGLAREALFYRHLWDELPHGSMPTIHYSYGDFETGQKCIIMEDIENSIDSGVLFGPGNPNNWKRDLAAISAKAGSPPPSSKEVALITFLEMAKIHATYWRNESLLTRDKTWLRGQEWLQGKGRESWEASQQMIQNMWQTYLDKESDNPVISWDANARSAVEKALRGISWEAQVRRLHPNGHWTLVHGDFWPGNVMWMVSESRCADKQIKFLDWEMVGLGSGPQELGQYIISNMNPEERRQCEKELVEAYYNELRRHVKGDDCCCTLEYCLKEYAIGGVERWLWFLVYFVGSGMDDWAQYFHDQIAAFMKDHKLTGDDITQPRP